MGRLKKLEFNSIEGFMEFYEYNKDYIHEETLKKLENYYKSKNKKGDVDVFDVYFQHKNDKNFIKITVFEADWEEALNDGLTLCVKKENFETAVRYKILLQKIKL